MNPVYQLTLVVGNTITYISEHATVADARSKATEIDNSFVFGSWSVSKDESWHFRHTETGRFDIDLKETA